MVNGNNCNDAGDLVCDTPADPCLSGVVGLDCVYNGNERDGNNTIFTPDTRNFMSYSRSACRNSFTEGQGVIMINALLGMNDERGYTLLACGNPGSHTPFRIKSISTGQFLTLRSNNNNGRIWLRDDSETGHPNQKFIAIDQNFSCHETNDDQSVLDNCYVIMSVSSGRGLVRSNRSDRIMRHKSIPSDFPRQYRLLFMPVSGKCNTYRIQSFINNNSQVFLTSNENGRRYLTFEPESGNANQEFEIVPTTTRTAIFSSFSITVEDLESWWPSTYDRVFITIKGPNLNFNTLPYQDIEEGETRVFDLSNEIAVLGRVGSTIKVYEHDSEGGHDLIGKIVITTDMINNGITTKSLTGHGANYRVSFEVVTE